MGSYKNSFFYCCGGALFANKKQTVEKSVIFALALALFSNTEIIAVG